MDLDRVLRQANPHRIQDGWKDVLDTDTNSTLSFKSSSVLSKQSEGGLSSSGVSPFEEKTSKSRHKPGDRFIPLRPELENTNRGYFFKDKENICSNTATNGEVHSGAGSPIFPTDEVPAKAKKRLLQFSRKEAAERGEKVSDEREEFTKEMANKGLIKKGRPEKRLGKGTTKAERVLDAPGLVDDYYLNLIDWGRNGLLAVCLGDGAFVWNPSTQEGRQFYNTEGTLNIPTSLGWSATSDNLIALGFSDSQVHVRDFEKDVLLRKYFDHWERVSAISWNPISGNIFSTASKDCTIKSYDTRMQNSISMLEGHTQEVCGLKWAPGGSLLASGGNDNKLMIWEPRKTSEPLFEFKDHKAAVKAVAWCPWQKNLIASGGGSEDKCIKLWRVDQGKMIASHKQSSQVCSLIWNPNERELLSAHGYSQFQLSLWKYPTMDLAAEYFGHKDRVLHTALSPDGTTVVSAGADETLRFWKVFDGSHDLLGLSGGKSILAPLNIR